MSPQNIYTNKKGRYIEKISNLPPILPVTITPTLKLVIKEKELSSDPAIFRELNFNPVDKIKFFFIEKWQLINVKTCQSKKLNIL